MGGHKACSVSCEVLHFRARQALCKMPLGSSSSDDDEHGKGPREDGAGLVEQHRGCKEMSVLAVGRHTGLWPGPLWKWLQGLNRTSLALLNPSCR